MSWRIALAAALRLVGPLAAAVLLAALLRAELPEDVARQCVDGLRRALSVL